jgi:hypothetical protein
VRDKLGMLIASVIISAFLLLFFAPIYYLPGVVLCTGPGSPAPSCFQYGYGSISFHYFGYGALYTHAYGLYYIVLGGEVGPSVANRYLVTYQTQIVLGIVATMILILLAFAVVVYPRLALRRNPIKMELMEGEDSLRRNEPFTWHKFLPLF